MEGENEENEVMYVLWWRLGVPVRVYKETSDASWPRVEVFVRAPNGKVDLPIV